MNVSTADHFQKGTPLARSLSVYLADADAAFRRRCTAALAGDGHHVVEVPDVVDLMTTFTWDGSGSRENVSDVLVIVAVQGSLSGALALAGSLRYHGGSIPFIVMARGVGPVVLREAARGGALAVFDKALGPEHLRRLVTGVAEDHWFLGRPGPVLAPSVNRGLCDDGGGQR